MQDLLQDGAITDWATQGSRLLLDAGLKGLVVLALAGVAAVLMRRRSAAARHLVWTLAMEGLLLLPLFSVCVPEWQLAVLPAKDAEDATDGSTKPSAALPRSAEKLPGEFPTDPVTAETTVAPPPSAAGSVAPSTQRNEPNPIAAPARARRRVPWSLLALLVWVLGAVVSVTPLVFGMWAARRLSRRGQVVEDEGWPKLSAQLEGVLRLRKAVPLVRTGAATMPMAWGFRRPVVLLPEDADAWPEAKRRVVLLHEFAHVKRRDCLTHALARLAFALHWFNPLAWVAMRRLRIERERACDDLVLNAGSKPADYAGHLLHIAGTMRNPSLASAAAITMARPGQLEKRLRAILDRNRNRGAVTLGFLLSGAIVALAILVPLAAVQLSEEVDEQRPGQQDGAKAHDIWEGYAVTNDAGLMLTRISVRPNERNWYSVGNLGNRGWLLSVWAENQTDEAQSVAVQVEAKTRGFLSGQERRVIVFEFPAGFSGAKEQPFKVESSWRENQVSLLVGKLADGKPKERLVALYPGTYEELYKGTFVIPFPDAEALPAKPILKAHRYARQRGQIYVEVEKADTEWQHPSGEDLPTVYVRAHGELRKANVSSSPFGSGKLGFSLDLGRNGGGERSEERVVTLGKHDFALVYRNVPAARRDDPEITTVFPEIVSNEIEVEIVEEIPDGYFQEVYEEGWEEALLQRLRRPSFIVQKHDGEVRIQKGADEGLPCAIAFNVSIEEEGSSETYEVGTLSAPADSHGHQSDSGGRELDVKPLFYKRWRVIYTPSQEVAAHKPDIRKYYGRELVTDWMKLEPEYGWVQRVLGEVGAEQISCHMQYHVREHEWCKDLDGTVQSIPQGNGPGWRYGKGADVAERMTKDGGGVHIQPDAKTRLLVLEGAHTPAEALARIRERLDDLMASTTTEVAARPNETMYVGVLTDEAGVAMIQMDTDGQGREKWLWCKDAVATAKLAGQIEHARYEVVGYIGDPGAEHRGFTRKLGDKGSWRWTYNGKTREVSWELLSTTPEFKRYWVSRRYPVDEEGNTLPETKEDTKSVVYKGGTVRLFEDEDTWIGIEETTWNVGQAPAEGDVQPPEEPIETPEVSAASDELSRIREQIFVLRHFVIPEHPDKWVPAIRKLAEMGEPAVPEIIAELRRGGNDYSQSALLITLRAIGDARVVPALIGLIGSTSFGDSDRQQMLGSEETRRYMRKVGKVEVDEGFPFMRPISELDGTLRALTGHDEGTEFFMVLPDDPSFARVRSEAAERWRAWWRANWTEFVSREALEETLSWDGMEQTDPVEAAGTGAYGVFIPRGPKVRFGPVMEKALGLKEGIDFETGQQSLRDGSLSRWIEEKGIDASAIRKEDDEGGVYGGLRTHGCAVWHLEESRWATMEQEIQSEGRLDLGNPREQAIAFSPDYRAYPHTYMFRTERGGVGLLQVKGVEKGSGAVLFRYRMLVEDGA